MNAFQLILSHISAMLFCISLIYACKSIFVYKKIDKYLFFSISTFGGFIFVLFELVLTYEVSPEEVLLYHRIRMGGLSVCMVSWVYAVYSIYFKNSKIPLIFLIWFSFCFIFIPTNLFVRLPYTTIEPNFFNIKFTYKISTQGIFYSINAIGIILVFIVSIIKISLIKIPFKKKIYGLIAFLPFIGGINDFAVAYKLINSIMISEYLVFIFLVATFIFFLKEEQNDYNKIQLLNIELSDKQNIIRTNFFNAMQIISSLISSTSTRIYEFTREVIRISVLLSQKLNLGTEEIWNIEIASTLHDLGMIGHIEKLLYSRKELSKKEFNIIQNHAQKSINIIANLPETEKIKQIIAQHHERYNGTGYPEGLKGDEIVLGARIIGLVDDFVSFLKKSRYQTLNKKEKIIEELKNQKDVLYDAGLVDVLIELIEEKNLIYEINEIDIICDQNNGNIIWKMPSNINFERLLTSKIMHEISSFIPDTGALYSIEYSIAEIIRNAIMHGNKFDEKKIVTAILNKENSNKLIIKIRDQGDGMDVSEHNRFSDARKSLISITKSLSDYLNELPVEYSKFFKDIVKDLTNFKFNFYSDFNTFIQSSAADLTGGIGLVQVKNTFDKVYFENIFLEDRICGLEVTLEKNIND